MANTASLCPISELYGGTAVVLVMINILHKLAKRSGSDERSITIAILTVTASIGGAVLFETLVF